MALKSSKKAGKKTGEKHVNPTAWKKGQSGNPKGRPPKGYSVVEMMKSMYANEPEKKAELIRAMHTAAVNFDVSAFKSIVSYLDGLPTPIKEPSEQDQARQEHSTKLYDAIKQAL